MTDTATHTAFDHMDESLKLESLKPFRDVTDDSAASNQNIVYAQTSPVYETTSFDGSTEEQIVGSHDPSCQILPQIRVLPTVRSSLNYRGLQLWEGRVESVGDNSFTAIISDRTKPDLPDESVEISLDELPDADRERVSPGALFIWSIAYVDAGSGRTTVSEIRFRRFRRWNGQSLKAVRKTRALLDSILDGE